MYFDLCNVCSELVLSNCFGQCSWIGNPRSSINIFGYGPLCTCRIDLWAAGTDFVVGMVLFVIFNIYVVRCGHFGVLVIIVYKTCFCGFGTG